MNIQRAAAESGLSADTIRYYERRGVLPPPPRTASGYRAYAADHIETLRLAKDLRDLGVPLAPLASILAAWHNGTCGDRRENLIETLTATKQQLDSQIASLRQARTRVTSLRESLEAMEPPDDALPGRQPCGCLVLVEQTGR